MNRRIGLPVRMQLRAVGHPRAFTWRDVIYPERVPSSWLLATRWLDYQKEADRTYYRVETPRSSDLRVLL